jgi:NADH-quinone oxidoreductase subunit G
LNYAATNFKGIDDARDYNQNLDEIKKSEDYKALMQKNDKFFSKEKSLK